MVRGNFQKRLELANARKISNKQIKNEHNKINKLKSVLDYYIKNSNESEETNNIIHIFTQQTDDFTKKQLCLQYFFHENCKNRKKCRFSHDLQMTLNHFIDSFEIRENAKLNLETKTSERINLEHRVIIQNLENIQNLKDIYYVIINNELIYDKHSDKTTPTDSPHHIEVDKNSHPLAGVLAQNLDINLLETVCSYLCDVESDPLAVGVMPQVCKHWSLIGRHSDFIWSSLLSITGWPRVPSNNAISLDESSSQAGAIASDAKRSFISHYSCTRTLNGISHGVAELPTMALGNNSCCMQSKGLNANREVSVQNFKSTQGSPQASGIKCISVKSWFTPEYVAANHFEIYGNNGEAQSNVDFSTVLAAYSDGTLRRFHSNAAAKNSCTSLCKQSLSVKLTPKTRGTELVAFDMDAQYVACLAKTATAHDHGVAIAYNYHLSTISREEIACTSSGGGQNGWVLEGTKHFDLRDLMLDFDHLDDQLFDLTTGDINITNMTESIVACGSGRFMLEVFVAAEEFVVSRILLIFSAVTRSLVDSYELDGGLHLPPDFWTLPVRTALSFERDESSLNISSVAFLLNSEPRRFVEVLFDGDEREVYYKRLDFRDVPDPNEFLSPRPKILLLPEQLVYCDTMFLKFENASFSCKSLVSFSRRGVNDEAISSMSGLTIWLEDFIVSNLQSLGNGYIVAAGYEATGSDLQMKIHSVDNGIPTAKVLVSQSKFLHFCGIIIYVPSASIIQKVSFGQQNEEVINLEEVPFQINFDPTMTVMAVHNLGLVCCGSSVQRQVDRDRHFEEVSCLESSKTDSNGGGNSAKKNKKGKRLSSGAKGRKKDGFARGMSMRG